MDEIFDGVDVLLSEDLLNSVVGLEGNSLLVDLAVTSLEDEFSDGFIGRITISNVGLNSSEHIDGGLVKLDKDTVVELSQSEESHDSDGLGIKFVNTSDSDHESDFRFGRYVDLTGELSLILYKIVHCAERRFQHVRLAGRRPSTIGPSSGRFLF